MPTEPLQVPADQPFVPVILGGDRSGYALARSFHEAYGTVSVSVNMLATGPVARSSIVTSHRVSSLSDTATLVPELRALAAELGDRPRLLIATTDQGVRRLTLMKAQLEDLYTIPYVDTELFDELTRKERFAELAAEVGMPHPTTVVHDFAVDGAAPPAGHGLTYPIIAKTSNATAWEAVDFPGKLKIHTAGSDAELADLFARIHASGYRDRFILQDMIPGNDQSMRILTCYCDRTGKVRFAGYGQVLLEEHEPATLGTPAAIITGQNHASVEHAVRLLEKVGWVGFANFDMKHDPRTGEEVFFELNPRLGGSNYYLTAAGHNPMHYYVEEWINGHRWAPDAPVVESTAERLYTVLPVALVLRYVTAPGARARVARLVANGLVRNPLLHHREHDPRRWLWTASHLGNQFRKFHRHYPKGR